MYEHEDISYYCDNEYDDVNCVSSLLDWCMVKVLSYVCVPFNRKTSDPYDITKISDLFEKEKSD